MTMAGQKERGDTRLWRHGLHDVWNGMCLNGKSVDVIAAASVVDVPPYCILVHFRRTSRYEIQRIFGTSGV